jgi:hypothetical protein
MLCAQSLFRDFPSFLDPNAWFTMKEPLRFLDGMVEHMTAVFPSFQKRRAPILLLMKQITIIECMIASEKTARQ